MMQKWWFKIFIWFAASSFFFLASVIIISYFNPAPSETEIMKFMKGMMICMGNSAMGLSMTLEGDNNLAIIINMVSYITAPLIFSGVLLGILFRIRGNKVDR